MKNKEVVCIYVRNREFKWEYNWFLRVCYFLNFE